jgi:hypothetical protein
MLKPKINDFCRLFNYICHVNYGLHSGGLQRYVEKVVKIGVLLLHDEVDIKATIGHCRR